MRRRPAMGGVGAHGFGTLEVLIALSLLSVALLSLSGLFMVALSAGTAAENSSVAANLARARLEELLAMTPSKIAAEDGATSLEQSSPGSGRTYQVHTAVDSAHPDFLDVTVTVTWRATFGSACASGRPGPACVGAAREQARTLEARVKR